MRKRTLFTAIAFMSVMLFAGCKENNIQEANSTKNESPETLLEVASTGQVETVRLKEDKVLPSGETYGIKYNLKINPELDIYADDNLLVTAVQALNDDAEELLGKIDAIGMDVASAVDYIVSESRSRGYMTQEKGNTVDLTIVEINETVMTECAECGGRGTVVCEDCHGTPFVTCQVCNGEKVHICEHCQGQEHNNGSNVDEGPVPCHNCNGSLWIDCENCNGTGRGPINCSHCGGTAACQACGGSGYIDVTAGGGSHEGEVVGTDACYRCHGSGVCQNCKGESDTYCPNCCEHNGPDGTIRNPGGIPGKVLCRECNGTGIEERSESNPEGENDVEDCQYCNGLGYYFCESCGGTGGYRCNCELNGYHWCGSCHGSGIQDLD